MGQSGGPGIEPATGSVVDLDVRGPVEVADPILIDLGVGELAVPRRKGGVVVPDGWHSRVDQDQELGPGARDGRSATGSPLGLLGVRFGVLQELLLEFVVPDAIVGTGSGACRSIDGSATDPGDGRATKSGRVARWFRPRAGWGI